MSKLELKENAYIILQLVKGNEKEVAEFVQYEDYEDGNIPDMSYVWNPDYNCDIRYGDYIIYFKQGGYYIVLNQVQFDKTFNVVKDE